MPKAEVRASDRENLQWSALKRTTLVKINLKNGGHVPSMSARPFSVDTTPLQCRGQGKGGVTGSDSKVRC